MIEVQSRFDSNLTNPLLKLQIRRMWWLFLLFSSLFILFGITNVIDPEMESDTVLGIMMIALGVLFLPLIFLLSKWLQKIMNKSLKVMNSETINYFRFDESRIFQEMIRGNEYKATSESSYTMLYKAYETQSHFFMYISNRQVHIIPKKDFITGTPQELTNIFSARLGKKFKFINIK